MKIYHLLLASAMALFSCCSDGIDEFEPIELNASTTRVVNSSNQFSMNIFRSMISDESKKNVVCSPLSVSSLLSMILNGADGLTALHDLATVRYPIKIFIPRFDISSSFDLVEHCKALGIKSLFDSEKACVPYMADEMLYVTKGDHLVEFSMNEQGVKAAAISIAELRESLGDANPPRSQYDPIHYDKPFLFCIMETSTKTVLFVGKVEKL